jgi:hypothetical protein
LVLLIAFAAPSLPAQSSLQSRTKSHIPLSASPAAAKVETISGFIKGGNISAWNITDAGKVLAEAKRLELNTLTVPVRVNMDSAGSSEVQIDPSSLAFAKKVAKMSRAYRIIIEPYPWIAGGSVPETALYPGDKAAWFESYQRVLTELCRQFPGAWGLYVASNLVRLEDDSVRWVSLVNQLRSSFHGKLIYRTQWWATMPRESNSLAAYHAKLRNPIFGAVDVIGIASYFELSDASAPTAAEIKAALRSTTVFNRRQDVVAEVMALQEAWHKPIFLGELSCPAVEYGAETPWDPAASRNGNTEIQKNYLSAYLEAFPRDTRRFLGFSLFTIGHPTTTTYDLAPSAVEYIQSFKPDRPVSVSPTRLLPGHKDGSAVSRSDPSRSTADPDN